MMKSSSVLLKDKRSKEIVKAVVRTVFYQFFLIFIGLVVGFIAAPSYWGNKAPIIERSVRNIFFPLEYNQNVEQHVMEFGKYRLWVELDCPPNLTCFNSKVINEEWYETDYSYEDADKNIVEGKYRTRIRWQPWEFYYPTPAESEPEKNF